jgi:hypothetical protein
MDLWCLTPLSTIYRLYHGGSFSNSCILLEVPVVIILSVFEWIYNFNQKLFPVDDIFIVFNAGFMIIPRITLKGLIFIQAHPYQYMKKHNKN